MITIIIVHQKALQKFQKIRGRFSDLFGIVGGGLPFGKLHLTQVPDHAMPRAIDSGILHLLFLHFIVDPHLVRAGDVLGIGNSA